MTNKNEKQILDLIKYSTPSFTILIFLIITAFLYFDYTKTFELEKKKIEHQHIKENKRIIKHQIERIYTYIINTQKKTESRLKESIKGRVKEAHAIASRIYQENKHKDKAVVTKMIKDALRDIRFNNGRGYFFIYELTGKNILHPTLPQLENKNLWNYQDAKGTYLLQIMNEYLKIKEETFYTWYWYKPKEEEKQYKKIGFFKKFEPYSWFIGTGEYFEDYTKDVKEGILDHIQNLSYKKDGYVFILNYKGNFLAHIKKELIGQNAFKVLVTEDKQTISNFIEIAKKGSGYIQYIHNEKPKTQLPTKKTSYIKGIQNWQWIIGKGFYEDDIQNTILLKKQDLEKDLKKNIQNLIIIAIILALLLFVISLYFSKLLESKFTTYQKEIEKFISEKDKQQALFAQQSKMAAIGEMMENIAHQWRQPLSVITTIASGIQFKKKLNILKEEDFTKNIDHINSSAQFLSKTIDDFRNFFKTNKKRAIFNIKETFEKTFNLIEAQLKNKDIKIIQNIEAVPIYNLENELIQVLLNILNNSRDELIKIKKQERLIFINVKKEDKKAIIEIQDNAGGIPEDIISHVFEPYVTTKHKSKGTGIGLYMSQQIITKNIQGEISIINTPIRYKNIMYQGAKTTIIIPLND